MDWLIDILPKWSVQALKIAFPSSSSLFWVAESDVAIPVECVGLVPGHTGEGRGHLQIVWFGQKDWLWMGQLVAVGWQGKYF